MLHQSPLAGGDNRKCRKAVFYLYVYRYRQTLSTPHIDKDGLLLIWREVIPVCSILSNPERLVKHCSVKYQSCPPLYLHFVRHRCCSKFHSTESIFVHQNDQEYYIHHKTAIFLSLKYIPNKNTKPSIRFFLILCVQHKRLLNLRRFSKRLCAEI